MHKTTMIAMALGAVTLAPFASAAGGVFYRDRAAFLGAIDAPRVESFEHAGATNDALDFGDGWSGSVIASTARTDHLFTHTDGYGAIASHGDRAWKLLGGATTIAFSESFGGALGFDFSDLESATLRVSFESDGVHTVDLTERNPHGHAFVGFAGSAPIRSVTLEFVGHQNDGVGFDAFIAGRIPSPGATALACLACALVRAGGSRGRAERTPGGRS